MSDHIHKLEFAGGAGIDYALENRMPIMVVSLEDYLRGNVLPLCHSPLEVWECECGYWEHRKA